MRRLTPNSNRPWTPEEDEQLRAMLLAGKSISVIAVRHKRSPSAIKARAQVLGLSVAADPLMRHQRAQEIAGR